MFALLGLIVLLIKIAFLASVYASITLLLLFFVSAGTKVRWLKKLMQKKIITWFSSGFIYSIILFAFAFSYWGYAGLGDYSCIPAGNGFVVSSIDAQECSYFEPDRKKYSRQAFIKNFTIAEGKLCAEFLGYNSDDCSECYIVFDTETEKLHEFHSKSEYLTYAISNGLPLQTSFADFNSNYQQYWGGLRNLFLP